MQNMDSKDFIVVLQLFGALFLVIVLVYKSLTSNRNDSYCIFNRQHCGLWWKNKAFNPKA